MTLTLRDAHPSARCLAIEFDTWTPIVERSMTRPPDHTITIVIPTFNRRSLLQKAVESVLEERRVPIVLHVFDNASDDETEAYVRALARQDPRVAYTRRPENIGATANYAQALASIETDYFVPLADDDWLLPDFLHDAHQLLEATPELGAAVFVTEARNAQGQVLTTYPTALDQIRYGELQPREHLEDWLRYGHYAWSSILWRTKTLECVGEPYLHVGLPSDVDFQAQIFCHYPVYLTRQTGAVYSLHDFQASGGYDVSHTPSWAHLFRRLDREIARERIFSREAYLPLREIAEQRYRICWTAPARKPWSVASRATAACLAGFRLGDWETAFSLVDDVPGLAGGSPSTGFDPTVVRLPPIGGRTLPAHPVSGGAATELVVAALGWMKQAVQTVAGLEQEKLRVEQERSKLEQDNARLQDENAQLRQTLSAASERKAQAELMAETSNQQRASAEAQLEALGNHPLLRAMKGLGLLRWSKTSG
ncbi:glycosyltransferase [Variovorax rhizosphaerae]|uniref:Glycosyltransferase n=1 Tax=Variovorax rhizosphaerae TaxID=1836200 RepID=A0ABU8WHS6_9BURK